MKINNYAIFAALIQCACISPESKTISIETDPPGAAIIVDGAYVGNSPSTAKITTQNCYWIGAASSKDGWRCPPVKIQALPRDGASKSGNLFSQEVLVVPNAMASDRVYMNLNLRSVHPVETINIK